MRTVAVLETDPLGHRMQYLRHLHDAVGAARCLVLTSEAAVRSQEYATHMAEAVPAPVVVSATIDSYRATLEAAIAWAHEAGAERLVVPDGDRYLTALAALLVRRPRLPLEVRILLMRTTTIRGPEHVRPATVVKPILVQLLRWTPRVRVLFLTDALGVVTARPGYPGVRPVKDPVVRPASETPGGHARPAWFPPADERLLVGVFGVITRRKNLPLLVEALVAEPDARMVVAGKLEPAVAEFVENSPAVRSLVAQGRLTVVPRMLDADELSAALASADVVAVLHDNDSPSGILAEACARYTPVVVPEGGWLDQVVTATGVGLAVPLTVAGIRSGLRRVVRERAAYEVATRRESSRLETTAFTEALVGD